MTTRAVFAIPGDLASLTGGYAYDREILARIGRRGVALQHLPLPASFPAPDARDLARTRDMLASLAAEIVVFADGLAFGAFTEELLDAVSAPIVAMVHHPLALETGLDPDRREALRRSERAALARVAHVVVPSAATKEALVADYGVAATAVTIAMPGCDRAERSVGGGDRLNLLSVGSVVPRKGYDVLIEALALLPERSWTLTIAGSRRRAPDYVAAIEQSIRHHGLDDRIALSGEVDAEGLERLYAQADVFVLASHFEGYGMVLAEAMAHGLPIVVTRGGAAGETAPDEAALKVQPGDPVGLSEALSRLIQAPDLRKLMADASFQAGRALPTWDDTAGIIASVLRRVDQGRHA